MPNTSKTSVSLEEFTEIRKVVARLLQLTLQKLKNDRFDIPDYELSELPETALIRDNEGVIQFLLKISEKPSQRWVTKAPTQWIGFGHVTDNLFDQLTPEQQLIVKLLVAAYPNPYKSSAT